MRRLPLRWRVALAFGALGFALCTVFAVSTAWITEHYEHLLISGIIEGQAAHYQAALREHPDLALPDSPHFAILRPSQVPDAYRALPPGVHEPHLLGREGLHVGVFGAPDERLYFKVDVGELESLEAYLVLIGILIILAGTVASAWLGWGLAALSLRPLARLAENVRRLPDRPASSRLATDVGGDEVGALARAIDGYQQRLADAEKRSQAFFSDASHELRTPITVVRGALEVIQDAPDLAERHRSRLDRIDRGMAELAASLDAVLLVARGAPGVAETLELVSQLQACVQRLAFDRGDGAGRFKFEPGPPVRTQAPSRLVDGVFSMVCLRMLARPEPAVWVVRGGPGELVFGRPEDAAARSPRSDSGLGLLFAERLCQELGWHLEEGEDASGLPWVRLRFPPTMPAA